MKNIKKIIGSALLAAAFAATSVGTTFALFTDDAKTTINVGSGKVAVGLTASEKKLYSADNTDHGKGTAGTIETGPFAGTYYYQEMSTAFANGGNATLENNVLAISRMTPGDKVSFKATINDSSNVNIKYRIAFESFKTTGSANKKLAEGLKIKTDLSGTDTTYTALDKYVSKWTYHEVNSTTPLNGTEFNFEIWLPIEAGNEYQNLSVEYRLNIQAVQGNAITVDESGIAYLQEEFSEVEEVVADTPTVIEASNSDDSISVKTTIPANATGVAADSEVKLVVSDCSVLNEQGEAEASLNFDVSLYVDEVKKESFTEWIDVVIEIGTGLNILSVKHNGVALEEGTENGQYHYDGTEGTISFKTKSFSPFEVRYEKLPDTRWGFANNYPATLPNPFTTNPLDTMEFFVHEVDDLDSLKAIGTYLNGTDSATDLHPYFKLTEDIDISHLYNAIDTSFRGVLDGNGKKIYGTEDEITISGVNGVAIFKTFDALDSSAFINLVLDKITVTATGEFAALLVGGTNAAAQTATVIFDNITATNKCRVSVAVSKAGTLLGKGYGAGTIRVTNCVSSAKIECFGGQNDNVGGFVGTVSNNPNELIMNNNTFSGELNAGNYCGFLLGQYNNGSPTKVEIKDNVIDGTFICVKEGASQIGYLACVDTTYSKAVTEISGNVVSANARVRLNIGSSNLDASYVSSHIVGHDKVTYNTTNHIWSDTIAAGEFVQMTVNKDSYLNNHEWVVTSIANAVRYRISLKIDGKYVTQEGSTATITNTHGITIYEEYDTVEELRAGFGRIQRFGYIYDDSIATFGNTVDDAYTINHRANFLRVSANGASVTAIGGSENLDKPVKVDGEWCLIISKPNAMVSPVGANFCYTIQAFNNKNAVIANFSYTDCIGSAMVPNNMANMIYSHAIDYTNPYHEYGGSYIY